MSTKGIIDLDMLFKLTPEKKTKIKKAFFIG